MKLSKLIVVLIVLLFAAAFSDKLAVKEIAEVNINNLSHNFAPYWLLGFPFHFLGLSRLGFIFVNLTSLFFLFRVLKLEFSTNLNPVLLIISFDILYFSSMSVRDIMYSVFFIVFIDCSYKGKIRLSYLAAAVLVWLRIESIIWLLLFTFTSNFRKKVTSLWLRVFLILSFPPIFFFALDIVNTVLVNFGMSNSSDDVYSLVLESRYFRQFGDVDGSSGTAYLLDEDTFFSIGEHLRLYLQYFSFVIVSYSVISLKTVLAILTGSVSVVYFLSRLSHKNMYRLDGFLIYWMSLAPLMVNAGNIYRMRLPIILISLVIYYEYAVVRHRR